MERYKRYLIEKLEMSEIDADLFLSDFEVVKFKKGGFLQEEGNKCNILRVLLHGCAKGYVVNDGK